MNTEATTTKPAKAKKPRKPRTYELLGLNSTSKEFSVITTDRPITGKADAVRYCKGKKLTGRFEVKVSIGTFSVSESKTLKVTVD